MINDKISSDKKSLLETKYIDYVKYLQDKGYTIEKMNIDEKSEIITITSLAKGSIGTVVDVRCPSGHKIIIPGREQLQENAYNLNAVFADKDNIEIAPDIRIRIIKEKISQEITIVETMFYKDITTMRYLKTLPNEIKSEDECYKFGQGIEIGPEQHLRIDVIMPDVNIDTPNVKFSLDIDLCEME